MTRDRIDFNQRITELIDRERHPESHEEHDPYTFHPSHMVVCRRQMFVRQLGLGHVDRRLKGIFHTGTLLHEWLEENLEFEDEGYMLREEPVEYELEPVKPTLQQGIRVKGTADLVDNKERVVYDYKTQKSIYPKDYHQDQLQLYMHSLALDEFEKPPKAGLVYMSKCDLTVQEHPDELIDYDPERVAEIKEKAIEVRDAIIDLMRDYVLGYDALKQRIEPGDIPFKKCGCYFCQQEDLIL